MVLAFLVLVASVAALAVSADRFVESAAGIAARLGAAPIVIGAVVIGFGTSVPEAIASSLAAAQGNIDVAVGNVLGSNAANLSLVLAVAAFFAVIPLVWAELRREFILMFVVWGWFAFAILDGRLARYEGLIALVLAVAAVSYTVFSPSPSADLDELEETSRSPFALGGLTLFWLGALALSAHFLVWSSLDIASTFGLSGGFAGAALVAVGTSLPEVFTAASAARRHDYGLLAGNVIGSNLFNAGFVGGIATLVGPGVFSSTLALGVNGVAFAIGAAVLLIALTVGKVQRWHALGLLAAFAGFLAVAAST